MSGLGSILVIDDDADVLRAARIALSPHVDQIETAASADGLKAKLDSATVDVVLLDMNFAAGERSGKQGMDALAAIQAADPTIATVLMTAYGGISLAVDALKHGAVDFVLKPWRNDKLVEAVSSAMNVTQARRNAESLDLERGAIERALARHEGNISLAAAALGLSRPALYRRMAKHGL